MYELSASAIEAFDYVINTRLTYEMLGEAVRMLERRARRNQRSVFEELKNEISYGTFRASWAGWNELAKRTLDVAKKDYLKHFPEEEAPSWIKEVDPSEVLRVALCHKDRFHGVRR